MGNAAGGGIRHMEDGERVPDHQRGCGEGDLRYLWNTAGRCSRDKIPSGGAADGFFGDSGTYTRLQPSGLCKGA